MFRVLGLVRLVLCVFCFLFRVWGFRGLGFGVWCLVFVVYDLGFGVKLYIYMYIFMHIKYMCVYLYLWCAVECLGIGGFCVLCLAFGVYD